MFSAAVSKRWADISDAQLIAHIQRRDSDWQKSFDALVARHDAALFARCLHNLRQRDDAADAMQETLIRVLRAIGGFKGESAFRTWLFAIADNQCWSTARRRARHELDVDAQDALRDYQEALQAAQVPRHDRCDHDCVASALSRVQQAQRDVLQLRYFADLSLAQIALTLGVGLSATKMRLYRAHDQVARLVDECRSAQAA